MVSGSQAVTPAVNTKLPYDLVKDLAAISQATSLHFVLYHTPALPVKSTKELIAHARANPGKVTYGTPGAGNLQHLGLKMFSQLTGVKLIHVPYKGGSAAVTAALSGEIQTGFTTLVTILPHMQSGRLRVLAITGKSRSPAAPEVPTIAEAGVPGYELDQWHGVVTGAKVPPAIIKKLNAGIVEALKAPDVVQRLSADVSMPASSSPGEFAGLIKADIAKWGKFVKDAGLVLN